MNRRFGKCLCYVLFALTFIAIGFALGKFYIPNDDGDSVSGVINGHEYVDLGLPSGTLWATCNIGASSPEMSGDYFAWGEATPKSDYSLSTYKYHNDYTIFNSDEKFLKGFVDAASVNWGRSWRIPTDEEWEELVSECYWRWASLNGVLGYMVKSKANGNSIFLPAAGSQQGSTPMNVGTLGHYWMNSTNRSEIDFNFIRFGIGYRTFNACESFKGLTIRPITRGSVEN